MNRYTPIHLTGMLAMASVATSAPAWITDYNQARHQAQISGKPILINFTGSDWCGWCKRLNVEVFATQDFARYAREQLILLEIDFPRQKRLSPTQTRANEALARKYRVTGYPTLVAVDSKGTELGRTGYLPGGPAPFINKVASMTGRPPSKQKAKPKVARPRTALPSPGAVQPGPQGLVLNGLSGSGAKRLAIINHRTFSIGEIGSVKSGNKSIRLKCLEIRKDSVIVLTEDPREKREIFLHGG